MRPGARSLPDRHARNAATACIVDLAVDNVLVIVGGAVAAGLGAIFTVAGTYWVSIPPR